jgi:hypothetical protein
MVGWLPAALVWSFVLLAVMFIVWMVAGAVIYRFRYPLVYGMLIAIVVFWIWKAFR